VKFRIKDYGVRIKKSKIKKNRIKDSGVRIRWKLKVLSLTPYSFNPYPFLFVPFFSPLTPSILNPHL